MKNKDFIIKVARRLDKFNFDEIVVISELEEQEVKEILTALQEEQIILKNNNTYYFNNQKKKSKSNEKTISNCVKQNKPKPIILEELKEYEYLLTFCEEVQIKVRKYIELINLGINTGNKNHKGVLAFFNSSSGYKKISISTYTKIRKRYERYGLLGLLPPKNINTNSNIPEELYTCFKHCYLNKDKLSVPEAIYQAQLQLQQEQKIEQPYVYSSRSFIRKLQTEFSQDQIEYFRNNIKRPKAIVKRVVSDEPLDMLFKDAANVYLSRLKTDKKLEKLMHDKTNYKNHLKEYFGDLKIKDITNKLVAKYKQEKFDNGFQLTSVNYYVQLLRDIVKAVCPNTNYLMTKKNPKNAYALNMNILTNEQIEKLLQLCKEAYPWAYPIIYISLSSGVSVPELLGLTWDRVDFERKTIYLKYFLYGDRLIMNRVGSSLRRVKIDDNICTLLQESSSASNPDEFVFKSKDTEHMQKYFEEQVLKPLSEALGISTLYPSDLQHNFVNMCLKQNIPLTYIQKSLGGYGIVNFVKMYRDLIEKLEEGYYNPLQNLKS